MHRLAYWVARAEPFYPGTCLTYGTFLPSMWSEKEEKKIKAGTLSWREASTWRNQKVIVLDQHARSFQTVTIYPICFDMRPTQYVVKPCPTAEVPYLITDDDTLTFTYQGKVQLEEEPELTFAIQHFSSKRFGVEGEGWVGLLERKRSRILRRVTWHLTAFAYSTQFRLTGHVAYTDSTPPIANIIALK